MEGIRAGVLSGLFGIGGGIVIVPTLLFLARMFPFTATGTPLAALRLPVGALGTYEYHKTGHLEPWRRCGSRSACSSGRTPAHGSRSTCHLSC
jgi:uncharacterized membrane protein YfcA